MNIAAERTRLKREPSSRSGSRNAGRYAPEIEENNGAFLVSTGFCTLNAKLAMVYLAFGGKRIYQKKI